MSTFCHVYTIENVNAGEVGGQKKLKSCQRSLSLITLINVIFCYFKSEGTVRPCVYSFSRDTQVLLIDTKYFISKIMSNSCWLCHKIQQSP